MNRLLLLLIPFLLLSCGGPKQDSQLPDSIGTSATKDVMKAVKSDDTLKSIIEQNINKTPVIDTVFLGFTFSMTKKEALMHYLQLVKRKKLVMNAKDQRPEYPMTFDLVKANATVAPEFENDKLYKLSLVIEPADDTATAQTIYYQVATAYMKKYSDYTLFQQPNLAFPEAKHMHWIKNNLHIQLDRNSDGCVVSYINMLGEKQADRAKTTASDSAQAQTKKDI